MSVVKEEALQGAIAVINGNPDLSAGRFFLDVRKGADQGRDQKISKGIEGHYRVTNLGPDTIVFAYDEGTNSQQVLTLHANQSGELRTGFGTSQPQATVFLPESSSVATGYFSRVVSKA